MKSERGAAVFVSLILRIIARALLLHGLAAAAAVVRDNHKRFAEGRKGLDRAGGGLTGARFNRLYKSPKKAPERTYGLERLQ